MEPNHEGVPEPEVTKKRGLTIKEALKNIEDFIAKPELKSAEFQAFTDAVDCFVAVEETKHNRTTGEDMKIGLIDETIRQRINGMKDYRNAHNTASFYIEQYQKAYKDENARVKIPTC